MRCDRLGQPAAPTTPRGAAQPGKTLVGIWEPGSAEAVHWMRSHESDPITRVSCVSGILSRKGRIDVNRRRLATFFPAQTVAVPLKLTVPAPKATRPVATPCRFHVSTIGHWIERPIPYWSVVCTVTVSFVGTSV